MDILKYKGYEGTVDVDMTRLVCRGKILFIADLVTYEADTPAGLQKEFEAAVDDYLETCAALGREAKKPLRGQFNVRIPSALHRAAVLRGLTDSLTLNDVVVRALDAYVNHNIQVTVEMTENSVTTLTATAAEVNSTWETMSAVQTRH